MVRKIPRLGTALNLGVGQAETDPLLQYAFYETDDYRAIQSSEDPRCFIVGRTGSGKSAALQRLQETRREHVVRINPESLSLPYITNLQVFRYLDDLEINLDPLWIALWKHVLLVEVIRKRYGITSQQVKQNVFHTLRDKIKRDPAKQQALDYLDQFENRFWCEADERVKEITQTFTKRIDAEAGAAVEIPPASVSVGGGEAYEKSIQERKQLRARYQHIVNDVQLARLNKMIEVLDEEILESDQNFTYVVIDDLDRDWVDERLSNDLIRCLFRTTLELQRTQHLKILVALRTNIFEQLDFGSRGGGQEEKFRNLVLPIRWTRMDLRHMLDERARVATERVGTPVNSFSELLPSKNRKRGNPLDYIFDRTLLRPRDSIVFANECLRVGAGKNRLSWADIHTAEAAYSHNRLLALRDEWKATYPGVEWLFEKFRSAPERMSRADFESRLDECMLLLADVKFPGTHWLTDLSKEMWTPGGTWFELYQPLTRFLYNMGLIVFTLHTGGELTTPLDDELLVESEARLAGVEEFVVHPAYALALDVKSE